MFGLQRCPGTYTFIKANHSTPDVADHVNLSSSLVNAISVREQNIFCFIVIRCENSRPHLEPLIRVILNKLHIAMLSLRTERRGRKHRTYSHIKAWPCQNVYSLHRIWYQLTLNGRARHSLTQIITSACKILIGKVNKSFPFRLILLTLHTRI